MRWLAVLSSTLERMSPELKMRGAREVEKMTRSSGHQSLARVAILQISFSPTLPNLSG